MIQKSHPDGKIMMQVKTALSGIEWWHRGLVFPENLSGVRNTGGSSWELIHTFFSAQTLLFLFLMVPQMKSSVSELQTLVSQTPRAVLLSWMIGWMEASSVEISLWLSWSVPGSWFWEDPEVIVFSVMDVIGQCSVLPRSPVLIPYLCVIQQCSHELCLAIEHLKCGWFSWRCAVVYNTHYISKT